MQSKRADGDVSVVVVVVLRKQAPPLEGALVEAAGVPVKKKHCFLGGFLGCWAFCCYIYKCNI